MKIVQNALFRSCAARFGQIAFLSVKVLQNRETGLKSLQSGKRGRFFRSCAFLQNRKRVRIFEHQSFQNRETGLKFFSKRKKSALFRSCAFLQNRKTMRIFERQSS